MADAHADGANADEDDGVAEAVRAFLLYVLLPAWTLPGFGDWVFHRKSKIERTSGTHESLTHALMMTCIALPTTASFVLEINAGVLVVSAVCCALHEAVTIWDVAYANNRRYVSPNEQHMHSFLEVLPLTSLSLIACLHWGQVLALAGAGPNPPDFSVRLKKRPLSPLYLAAIGALITATIAVPYAEELIRCYRVDQTFKPHPRVEAPKEPADSE